MQCITAVLIYLDTRQYIKTSLKYSNVHTPSPGK